jgi:hypothetical protein
VLRFLYERQRQPLDDSPSGADAGERTADRATAESAQQDPSAAQLRVVAGSS